MLDTARAYGLEERKMGTETAIAWTDHTFNPWMGCLKVSPGCEHCYAETLVKGRFKLPVWGPPKTTDRKHTSVSNWKQPLTWNRAAAKAGVRDRVFCASLADVFEDHAQVAPWRAELFALIEVTPHLDWQLLTKRPENLRRFLPPSWLDKPRANVWLGTTVEDQRRANERIPHLLATPASVRFLSCEPLLEAVDLGAFEVRADHHFRDALSKRNGRWGTCAACPRVEGAVFPERCEFTGRYDHQLQPPGIHWLIAGGESGPGARPFDLAWARSLRDQCKSAGVAYFCKQVGSHPRCDRTDAIQLAAKGRWVADAPGAPYGRAWPYDRAGADPAEWPEDLRVQQFPQVPRG